MEQRITKSAATAVATGAGMWIVGAVLGKTALALGIKPTNAIAVQKTAFTLGMIGAGVVREKEDHAYATACVAMGAGYGLYAVAVAVAEPIVPQVGTGNAAGLPSGASMLDAKYVGKDQDGVEVYTAEYQ